MCHVKHSSISAALLGRPHREDGRHCGGGRSKFETIFGREEVSAKHSVRRASWLHPPRGSNIGGGSPKWKVGTQSRKPGPFWNGSEGGKAGVGVEFGIFRTWRSWMCGVGLCCLVFVVVLSSCMWSWPYWCRSSAVGEFFLMSVSD